MTMTSPQEKTAAEEQARTAPLERDIELAVTALKKGAQLLKYGRRGKPKFCPFRLANDESALIWLSGKEEKHIKLSHVSRIVPGQHTPIFQRYPWPEKECQSFSLLYNGRSLDLICKDKEEAEVWFAGLKALISRFHLHKGGEEARSGVSSEANSRRAYMQSSSLSSALGSGNNLQKDGMDPNRLHTPYDSTPKVGLEALSDIVLYAVPPKALLASGAVQSFPSEGTNIITACIKGTNVDACRVSLSSAVSSSSQESGLDDSDALGDVYIWGEGTGNGLLGRDTQRVEEFGIMMDSFVPKALESAVLLDVQGIACGRQHAALVTKQGEVFSWGKERGGRLGHGIDSDILHPKLVDGLKNINVELVACGENHSCAVTLSGELYMWGGHTYNFGLLGCTQEAVQWIPKKLCGPLEGVHVSSVSCGPWHTAVVTSAGQLFTFGDGTFGVLGHGDRKSVSKPREVTSLKGLRTVNAACGVWHTAAVVEVMGSSTSSNCSSGKLFTWGDGDKGRLGHGDKEVRLVPTCVAAIVEPNFRRVACGHSLTAAVTSTGHVYTMGSPAYGQLGNPHTDGKVPSRVEGKLMNNFVEELACGAYHIAVLTSKTEVYTWGKGANGRLGHGDSDDRNSPSIVEALKDKEVKSIVCGTSFTAAICLHKWVSGTDQSTCTGCRLMFNFKRKQHNCYNCGLVFCHSCSSRKSLKASMAPNSNKVYRVCDSCLSKLSKGTKPDSLSHLTILSRRGSVNQGASEVKEENLNTRSHVQLGRSSSIELSKAVQHGSAVRNKKLNSTRTHVSASANDPSQHNASHSSKSFMSSKKFFSASLPGSRIVSRASSPTSKGSGLPRASTPIPILSAYSFPKVIVDDDRRSNSSLNEEAVKLRDQVDELMRKVQIKEVELEKTTKQLKDALALAGEENAKRIAAKEVIKSLTAQLKDMAEKLPVGALRNSNSPSAYSGTTLPRIVSSAVVEQLSNPTTYQKPDSNGLNTQLLSYVPVTTTNATSDHSEVARLVSTIRSKSRTAKVEPSHEDEWVEQDEPGVYVTLVSLPGGAKNLKRVHFSRKRFSEKQAEQWWAANKDRVHQQHNVPTVDKSIVSVGGKA